jgi:hypothetical protein
VIDEPALTPPVEPARSRSRLLAVSAGTNAEAFRPVDWAMLIAVALTWGASFLFIDIGLDAFSPTVVAFARIALGALALAVVPSARARRWRLRPPTPSRKRKSSRARARS